VKILLINHYAGSPYYGMEFRPFYMAREWVRSAHKVQVVAASYSHIRTNQPTLIGDVLDENNQGIAYRWYKTPAHSGNGVGRVRNMLSFLRLLRKDAARLARDFEPDVVIASSTYPMDIWPASRIAKLAGAKLVFEVHDLWPLSPMELGGMSKWHPFIIWVQMSEDYAYRRADKVISMLPKAKEYMCSRGMAVDKFVYVPNGVDAEEWDKPDDLPLNVAEPLTRLRNKGLPIVGYAGTHGLANALDVLLDASKCLTGKVEIILVGKGPDRDRFVRRVKKEKLSNVLMLPSIPKKSIPSFLAAIDIAYIGWHPNSLYRFGISPNKLVDYMMSGKPIVHSVDAGNDPVAEAACGITVPPGDPAAVAQAIIRLVEMPEEAREAMGNAGQQFVQDNQTYGVLAQNFLRSIEYSNA